MAEKRDRYGVGGNPSIAPRGNGYGSGNGNGGRGYNGRAPPNLGFDGRESSFAGREQNDERYGSRPPNTPMTPYTPYTPVTVGYDGGESSISAATPRHDRYYGEESAMGGRPAVMPGTAGYYGGESSFNISTPRTERYDGRESYVDGRTPRTGRYDAAESTISVGTPQTGRFDPGMESSIAHPDTPRTAHYDTTATTMSMDPSRTGPYDKENTITVAEYYDPERAREHERQMMEREKFERERGMRQPSGMEYGPPHTQVLSTSGSSTSSYLDISHHFPTKGFSFRSFFSTPSEKSDSKRKKKKTKKLTKHNTSSSSSLNEDLAFGTGFLRYRRKRNVRSRDGRDRQWETVGYKSSKENLRDARSSTNERPTSAKRSTTNAEILALGAGLAKLVRDHNKKDVKNGKNGRGVPETGSRGDDRGLPPSRIIPYETNPNDDDAWESASDDESDSSVDTGLAFGGGNHVAKSQGGFFGRRKTHGPKSRKSSVVDPRLLGPQNSLNGFLSDRASGFEDVQWESSSDFGQHTYTSYNHPDRHVDEVYVRERERVSRTQSVGSGSQAPLQQVFPVPTNDPSRFDVARESSSEYNTPRPAPVPIQQPQPITPVSQNVYHEPKYVRSESGGILKSSSGRSKSLAGAALAGVAGAALGAAMASSRRDEKDNSRGDDRKDQRSYSESAVSRRDDDRKERRRDDDQYSIAERSSTKPRDDDRKERRRDYDQPSIVDSNLTWDEKREKRREERRKDDSRSSASNSERDKIREKIRDDPDAAAEERERRRRERREERRAPDRVEDNYEERRSHVLSEISAAARTPPDPFQYQVADSPTREESSSRPREESLPSVVTVEREPDFTRKRSSSIKESSSVSRSESRTDVLDKDDREQRRRDNARDLHDAEKIYEETEHSTAPIAAAAIAAAAAVMVKEGIRESRSAKRRGERRTDSEDLPKDVDSTKGPEQSHDEVMAEADRAYREIVMARKVAAEVRRSRTPSPERSVINKYEEESEEEPPLIVTPPGMHEPKKGPYGPPNADFKLDYIMTPRDVKVYSIPSMRYKVDQADLKGPFMTKDADAKLPRPILNLILPTPTSTPSPEKQFASMAKNGNGKTESSNRSQDRSIERSRSEPEPETEPEPERYAKTRNRDEGIEQTSTRSQDEAIKPRDKIQSREQTSSYRSEDEQRDRTQAREQTSYRSEDEPRDQDRRKRKTRDIPPIIINPRADLVRSYDVSVSSPVQSTVSKAVTWGPNETKHFEVESPTEHRDEFISDSSPEAPEMTRYSEASSEPKPEPKSASGWAAMAAGILGAGVGAALAGSSESSKGPEVSEPPRTSNAKDDARDERSYEYRGVVVEPESPYGDWRRESPPTDMRRQSPPKITRKDSLPRDAVFELGREILARESRRNSPPQDTGRESPPKITRKDSLPRDAVFELGREILARESRRNSPTQDTSRDLPQVTRQESPPSVGPKPVPVQSSHMPGSFDDDLDFTATVAAGLQDTGFNPDLVIEDPAFRKRDSPPGSNEYAYKAPWAESITDISSIPVEGDSSLNPGFVMDEVSETPKDWSIISPANEESSKLRNREQRNRDKELRRSGGDVSSQISDIIVEEPESYSESSRQSRKEQKNRDKEETRRQSLLREESSFVDISPTGELFEEPESYTEPVDTAKKSQKSTRSSTYDDDGIDPPASTPKRKSIRRSSTFDDKVASPLRESRRTFSLDDIKSGDESKILRKSKRDSGRIDSPSNSAPPSEVGSDSGRSSRKKSKERSRFDSPDPSQISLPASDNSREDLDLSREPERPSRRDVDDPLWASSRSILSADSSTKVDDEDSLRKQRKDRSSTKDDNDITRPVASEPTRDENVDPKKKAKDTPKKSSSLFGFFSGAKADAAKGEPAKGTRDSDEAKKKKKKRSSTSDGLTGSQPFNDLSQLESSETNGNKSRNEGSAQDSRNDGDRKRSKSSDSKKDSFLDNAGILGAGVGLAAGAIATSVQHQQQNAASNNDSEGTTGDRGNMGEQEREEEILDPEIIERQIRPSIDPQYGDLLPLPPSGPVSPNFEPIDDLPKLPESRPATPESEKRTVGTPREKTPRNRKSLQETPVKSPSQSAVPLKFVMGNRSNPTSPILTRSTGNTPFPAFQPSPIAESAIVPRSRSRPMSWDNTKEFKPLYLLETNRRGSFVPEELIEPLPQLPPSRTNSELDVADLPESGFLEKWDLHRPSVDPLSTSLPSDDMASGDSTPTAITFKRGLAPSVEFLQDSFPSFEEKENSNLSSDVHPHESSSSDSVVDAIGAAAIATAAGLAIASHDTRNEQESRSVQEFRDQSGNDNPECSSESHDITAEREKTLQTLSGSSDTQTMSIEEEVEPTEEFPLFQSKKIEKEGNGLTLASDDIIDQAENTPEPTQDFEPVPTQIEAENFEPVEEVSTSESKEKNGKKGEATSLEQESALQPETPGQEDTQEPKFDNVSSEQHTVIEPSQDFVEEVAAPLEVEPAEDLSTGMDKKNKKTGKNATSFVPELEKDIMGNVEPLKSMDEFLSLDKSVEQQQEQVPESGQETVEEPLSVEIDPVEQFSVPKSKKDKKKDKKKAKATASEPQGLILEPVVEPPTVEMPTRGRSVEESSPLSREIPDPSSLVDPEAHTVHDSTILQTPGDLTPTVDEFPSPKSKRDKKKAKKSKNVSLDPESAQAVIEPNPSEPVVSQLQEVTRETPLEISQEPVQETIQEPTTPANIESIEEFSTPKSKKNKKDKKKAKKEPDMITGSESVGAVHEQEQVPEVQEKDIVETPILEETPTLDHVTEGITSPSSKKSKKKNKKGKAADIEEPVEPPIDSPIPESVSEKPTPIVGPGGWPITPATPWTADAREASKSNDKDYFPAAETILPAVTAGAAIFGAEQLKSDESSQDKSKHDGLAAGYGNDQLSLAKQLQEEFAAGNKRSRKDKKKRHSQTTTPERSLSRSRSIEKSHFEPPRSRSASVAPSAMSEGEELKRVYSHEQLELARQLQEEFGSGSGSSSSKKSKKDKRRSRLSRSTTREEVSNESSELQEGMTEEAPKDLGDSGTKPDGLSAGYQEDQSSLARQLAAGVGKESEMDKKIPSAPQTPQEEQGQFFDEPEQIPVMESQTEEKLFPRETEAPDQLALAQQLKEEFESATDTDKKGKERANQNQDVEFPSDIPPLDHTTKDVNEQADIPTPQPAITETLTNKDVTEQPEEIAPSQRRQKSKKKRSKQEKIAPVDNAIADLPPREATETETMTREPEPVITPAPVYPIIAGPEPEVLTSGKKSKRLKKRDSLLAPKSSRDAQMTPELVHDDGIDVDVDVDVDVEKRERVASERGWRGILGGGDVEAGVEGEAGTRGLGRDALDQSIIVGRGSGLGNLDDVQSGEIKSEGVKSEGVTSEEAKPADIQQEILATPLETSTVDREIELSTPPKKSKKDKKKRGKQAQDSIKDDVVSEDITPSSESSNIEPPVEESSSAPVEQIITIPAKESTPNDAPMTAGLSGLMGPLTGRRKGVLEMVQALGWGKKKDKAAIAAAEQGLPPRPSTARAASESFMFTPRAIPESSMSKVLEAEPIAAPPPYEEFEERALPDKVSNNGKNIASADPEPVPSIVIEEEPLPIETKEESTQQILEPPVTKPTEEVQPDTAPKRQKGKKRHSLQSFVSEEASKAFRGRESAVIESETPSLTTDPAFIAQSRDLTSEPNLVRDPPAEEKMEPELVLEGNPVIEETQPRNSENDNSLFLESTGEPLEIPPASALEHGHTFDAPLEHIEEPVVERSGEPGDIPREIVREDVFAPQLLPEQTIEESSEVPHQVMEEATREHIPEPIIERFDESVEIPREVLQEHVSATQASFEHVPESSAPSLPSEPVLEETTKNIQEGIETSVSDESLLSKEMIPEDIVACVADIELSHGVEEPFLVREPVSEETDNNFTVINPNTAENLPLPRDTIPEEEARSFKNAEPSHGVEESLLPREPLLEETSKDVDELLSKQASPQEESGKVEIIEPSHAIEENLLPTQPAENIQIADPVPSDMPIIKKPETRDETTLPGPKKSKKSKKNKRSKDKSGPEPEASTEVTREPEQTLVAEEPISEKPFENAESIDRGILERPVEKPVEVAELEHRIGLDPTEVPLPEDLGSEFIELKERENVDVLEPSLEHINSNPIHEESIVNPEIENPKAHEDFNYLEHVASIPLPEDTFEKLNDYSEPENSELAKAPMEQTSERPSDHKVPANREALEFLEPTSPTLEKSIQAPVPVSPKRSRKDKKKRKSTASIPSAEEYLPSEPLPVTETRAVEPISEEVSQIPDFPIAGPSNETSFNEPQASEHISAESSPETEQKPIVDRAVREFEVKQENAPDSISPGPLENQQGIESASKDITDSPEINLTDAPVKKSKKSKKKRKSLVTNPTDELPTQSTSEVAGPSQPIVQPTTEELHRDLVPEETIKDITPETITLHNPVYEPEPTEKDNIISEKPEIESLLSESQKDIPREPIMESENGKEEALVPQESIVPRESSIESTIAEEEPIIEPEIGREEAFIPEESIVPQESMIESSSNDEERFVLRESITEPEIIKEEAFSPEESIVESTTSQPQTNALQDPFVEPEMTKEESFVPQEATIESRINEEEPTFQQELKNAPAVSDPGLNLAQDSAMEPITGEEQFGIRKPVIEVTIPEPEQIALPESPIEPQSLELESELEPEVPFHQEPVVEPKIIGDAPISQECAIDSQNSDRELAIPRELPLEQKIVEPEQIALPESPIEQEAPELEIPFQQQPISEPETHIAEGPMLPQERSIEPVVPQELPLEQNIAEPAQIALPESPIEQKAFEQEIPLGQENVVESKDRSIDFALLGQELSASEALPLEQKFAERELVISQDPIETKMTEEVPISHEQAAGSQSSEPDSTISQELPIEQTFTPPEMINDEEPRIMKEATTLQEPSIEPKILESETIIPDTVPDQSKNDFEPISQDSINVALTSQAPEIQAPVTVSDDLDLVIESASSSQPIFSEPFEPVTSIEPITSDPIDSTYNTEPIAHEKFIDPILRTEPFTPELAEPVHGQHSTESLPIETGPAPKYEWDGPIEESKENEKGGSFSESIEGSSDVVPQLTEGDAKELVQEVSKEPAQELFVDAVESLPVEEIVRGGTNGDLREPIETVEPDFKRFAQEPAEKPIPEVIKPIHEEEFTTNPIFETAQQQIEDVVPGSKETKLDEFEAMPVEELPKVDIPRETLIEEDPKEEHIPGEDDVKDREFGFSSPVQFTPKDTQLGVPDVLESVPAEITLDEFKAMPTGEMPKEVQQQTKDEWDSVSTKKSKKDKKKRKSTLSNPLNPEVPNVATELPEDIPSNSGKPQELPPTIDNDVPDTHTSFQVPQVEAIVRGDDLFGTSHDKKGKAISSRESDPESPRLVVPNTVAVSEIQNVEPGERLFTSPIPMRDTVQTSEPITKSETILHATSSSSSKPITEEPDNVSTDLSRMYSKKDKRKRHATIDIDTPKDDRRTFWASEVPEAEVTRDAPVIEDIGRDEFYSHIASSVKSPLTNEFSRPPAKKGKKNTKRESVNMEDFRPPIGEDLPKNKPMKERKEMPSVVATTAAIASAAFLAGKSKEPEVESFKEEESLPAEKYSEEENRQSIDKRETTDDVFDGPLRWEDKSPKVFEETKNEFGEAKNDGYNSDGFQKEHMIVQELERMENTQEPMVEKPGKLSEVEPREIRTPTPTIPSPVVDDAKLVQEPEQMMSTQELMIKAPSEPEIQEPRDIKTPTPLSPVLDNAKLVQEPEQMETPQEEMIETSAEPEEVKHTIVQELKQMGNIQEPAVQMPAESMIVERTIVQEPEQMETPQEPMVQIPANSMIEAREIRTPTPQNLTTDDDKHPEIETVPAAKHYALSSSPSPRRSPPAREPRGDLPEEYLSRPSRREMDRKKRKKQAEVDNTQDLLPAPIQEALRNTIIEPRARDISPSPISSPTAERAKRARSKSRPPSRPGTPGLTILQEESESEHSTNVENRDSAFVGDSPIPLQGNFTEQHEHIRDSGVHLRDNSPSMHVRAPVSSTDAAIESMAWPSMDEDAGTVDLKQPQRPKVVESLKHHDHGIDDLPSQKHREEKNTDLHRTSAIHRVHSPHEEKHKLTRKTSLSRGELAEANHVDFVRSQRLKAFQTKSKEKLSEPHQAEPINKAVTPERENTRHRVHRSELPDLQYRKPKENKYGDLEPVKTPTKTPKTPQTEQRSVSESSPSLVGSAALAAAGLGFAAARRSSQESRPLSAQSHKSQRSASNISVTRLRTPIQLDAPQPPQFTDGASTNRSFTPPLRRTARKVSGDLRSLRQQSNIELAKEIDPASVDTATSTTSTNTSNPTANEGRARAQEMADVYDGYGEGRMGSPRSPTRPHSMRRRQSMQVLELESKLDQLAAENRALAESKAHAEHMLRSSQGAPAALVERDAQIDLLKRTLASMQDEVKRLTEVNAGLSSAAVTLGQQHNARYGTLESQHAQTSRELQQTREAHHNLQSEVDGIIHNAIQERDQEIASLRSQLDAAKEQIRAMQREILAAKAGDAQFLTIRDEDYFDNACQQLCQHVQQWVLRFSKFSDMRACRLTSEINNDKTIDRLDNAILDGSDVDSYLADRVRRRDVFMSMTMTMVWEFIFTRYLFGMDREQRQKLKSLEKVLSEVGPPSAVHQWRATTLTLLSKRESFARQREQDTLAVVHAVFETLTEILPPPSHLEGQIEEQLKRVIKAAVDLSIEMRTQRAEYMMLPPLQPEYDANGDLASKVSFNAALMNERSGDTISNEDLEAQKAVVRVVLFPLVVKKGDDLGQGDEEIVVCPAQVLVARPRLTKGPVGRVYSPASGVNVDMDRRSDRSRTPASMQSSMPDTNVI
ncbi:hypothetical protein NHQ30_010687 [Ciborinia camelliae]|nr:hypothetical protein NHQ30_010687 [Ciborinia camelliae]